MRSPVITVGLPVFNGISYLADAVQSILGQTFGEFELLLADNASIDGTLEMCHTFASQDERVRVLASETNRGLAWNWNRVVVEARAPMFRWACHDDLLHPDLLARCHALLREAPSHVALVYPQTIDIDESQEIIERYEDNLDLREPTSHERFGHLLHTLARCNPLFGLMRTDHLRRTGLMGSFAHADQVLLGQLALGGQWWELPEALFYRRIHPGSSLNAYPDPAELTKFYDTGASGKYFFPYARIFIEHARSIGRAALPPGEKVQCWTALVREWRFKRTMVGEARGALRQFLATKTKQVPPAS